MKFLSTFISRLYGTNSSFVIQTNLQYDENRSPDDSINKFETLCLSRRQWTMQNTIVVLLFLLHYIPSGGITSQNALPAYMSGFSKRCGSKEGQRCPCPFCKKKSIFIYLMSKRKKLCPLHVSMDCTFVNVSKIYATIHYQKRFH